MKLKCKHVSATEAGDEIFQLLFAVKRDIDGGPYLMIQREFLEEDEGAFGSSYVETHEERLIGYYPNLEAELTRSRLTLRLPPPANETIEVEFLTSDAAFSEVRRVLGIILQREFGELPPTHSSG
jgi:hypothetical protein